MVRLRRPSEAQLAELLTRAATHDFTYHPVGLAFGPVTPPGFHRRRWSTVLEGSDAFERAVVAITTWAVHRGSGLSVVADGPVAAGTNVAMAAPLPVGFVDVTCRVVATVEERDRVGFAYGTLPVHPERGEESFIVRRQSDGIGPRTVRFDVEAVSALAHPLARLVPPFADWLQAAATSRYLTAMREATA